MTKPYKCRVEYLESTGTQWIDTGIMGNGEFNIKYGLYANSIGSSSDIFAGARSSTQHLNFGQAASNGQFTLGYLNQYWQELSNFAINTRYDIEISYKSGEQYAIINGTKGSSKTYTGTEQTDLTIYLFKRHHYGTDNVGGLQGRIYYFTIKQNDVLVRDMIPVLDNSGRPAMYDQVSGQLFYNQGTGEFTYGRQIIPVEYLESTGTQYIDTGVKGKNNLQYKTKINYTNLSTSASNGIGGEYLGNASAYIGMVRANGHFTYLFNNTAVETTKTFYANTDYVIDSTMNNGSQVVKVNNETISTGTISGTFTSTRNIFLYAICSTNDAADVYGSLKIYYLQIYDNDTLVRDFIPCIDENLTPFMFDLVSNTCYLNAGTGQFKVGPNVEKVWGGKKLRRKLALALANLKKPRKYYCEVEYLEGTGTQYIDTGLDYFADFEVGIKLRNNVSNKALGNGAFYCMQRYSQANPYWYFSTGGNNSYTSSTRITEYHVMKWKDDTIYADGIQITTKQKSSNSGNSMSLFGAGGNKYPNMIYFCKLWNPADGTLVRDFIPVLDWDMTPCMYDKVTGQLFYNVGTGNFIAGREIHQVEYLESTGTQYIDTGVKLTNNHSVEVDYQLTSASQSRKGIYGGLVSNGARNGALLSPSNNYLEFGYGSSNVWYQTGLPDTKRHTMKQQKNLLYFDGVLIYTFNSATFTQNFTAPLGNFAYTNYAPASAKYYSSKWWDGDTLVRDYRPAIDENGVAFWFDRVTHTIYDNAGTDIFKYPAKETTYTANAATPAYIDLGVKYKPSMSIEGKYTRDTAGASGSVILVTTTTTAPLIYLPALSGTKTERFVWRRGGYTEQNFFVNNITYPYTVEMVVDAVNDTLTLNGNVVKTGMIAGMNGYDSPYQSDSNMMMFSIAGTYAGDGKVYYLKIKDGTTPVMDLVPAYKDGAAGFYNKITGTFYGNASTNANAALTAGKIVEPEYE